MSAKSKRALEKVVERLVFSKQFSSLGPPTQRSIVIGLNSRTNKSLHNHSQFPTFWAILLFCCDCTLGLEIGLDLYIIGIIIHYRLAPGPSPGFHLGGCTKKVSRGAPNKIISQWAELWQAKKNFAFFDEILAIKDSRMWVKISPAVPIGAAGGRFLKFDLFYCISKSIFAF